MGMETAPSTLAMEIFGRAAANDDRDMRAVYLDRACEGDPALRAEVESLLSTLGRIGGFLEPPEIAEASTLGFPGLSVWHIARIFGAWNELHR